MKKILIHLIKLDLYAMMRESVIEIFFPILFFLYPFFVKNFSLSFIRIIFLFIPIICLNIMLKGLTFSLFINYIKTLDLLLIYFSIKYIVINLLISLITTLVFNHFINIQIEYTVFSIFVVSIFILSCYFLLFFYFLSSYEPELISGTLLFVLCNIVFYPIYYFFNKIGYWSIGFMVFMLFLYFKTIVPLFKMIMLNRFQKIMEKIL